MRNEFETYTFKDYPMERLMITSIRSRLDERENSMRDEIMNEIIDAGGPVAVDSICIKMEAEEEQRRGIIESLLAKRVIVLDGENQYITFVYPVSALPTAHKVTLADGRSFFAMCAIDSLGAAFTFKQDTQVQSQCAACGAPVAARVVNGQLHEVQPASLFILHVDLACTDNWAGSW